MNEKIKNVINRSVSYLLTALTVLFGATMVYVLAKKAQGEVPKIFGYTVLQIVSGSMEKEIPTGAYILVKEVDADEIGKDDVISFYSSDPSILGYPNTHRVVDIIEGEQGLEFVTRGDANATDDAYNAKEDQLIGKYVKTLTGLTATVEFFATNGMGVVGVMMFLSIGMVCVSGFIKGKDEKKD
jgi:signal peptidase